MKKILIIQSRSQKAMIDAEQKEYQIATEGNAELSFISSLDANLPWQDPTAILKDADALIIGGAGEFFLDGGLTNDDPAQQGAHLVSARLTLLIEHVVSHDFPTVGVCFGHQLIARVYGGSILNDTTQKKVGTHLVNVNTEGHEDRMLSMMPPCFSAQYGHHDSVTALPRGATLLATGKHCRFSALRYGTNIYSFQYHPELTKSDILRKLKSSPGYLPPEADPQTLVDESPEASRIISRFVDCIV